jgi:hypothetical protein
MDDCADTLTESKTNMSDVTLKNQFFFIEMRFEIIVEISEVNKSIMCKIPDKDSFF